MKALLEEQSVEKDEAEAFRARLKYNQANSSTIDLDDKMKGIVTSILKGDITAKKASEVYHIDRETIKRKINEFIKEDSSLFRQYIEYLEKSGRDYTSINFRGLLVQMIRNNMSQSEMAQEYGIPARTVSRELEKIGKSEAEEDKKLFNIAKIYADKKMRREKLSVYEIDLYTKILDEEFGEIAIIEPDAISKDDIEIQKLEEFVREAEEYQHNGMTIQQVADKMNVGISTIRRHKLKLEELRKKKEINEQIEGR